MNEEEAWDIIAEADTRLYPYTDAVQAVQVMTAFRSPISLAAGLDIDDAHIYRALKGDVTKTLKRKLQELGLIPPPRKRVRFSGDTRLAAEIAAEARRRKMTNGEMIDLMWGCYAAVMLDDDTLLSK